MLSVVIFTTILNLCETRTRTIYLFSDKYSSRVLQFPHFLVVDLVIIEVNLSSFMFLLIFVSMCIFFYFALCSGGDCSVKFKNLMNEISKSQTLWDKYYSIRNE